MIMEKGLLTLATFMIIISSAVMPFYSYVHAAYFTLRSGGKVGITFLFDSEVIEPLGENKLSGVLVRNKKTGEVTQLEAEGLFISIGRDPATELFSDQLLLENGYIVADESTRTSIDGVFAVGDVRIKPLRQVVTATADGAVAVHFAEEYLAGLHSS